MERTRRDSARVLRAASPRARQRRPGGTRLGERLGDGGGGAAVHQRVARAGVGAAELEEAAAGTTRKVARAKRLQVSAQERRTRATPRAPRWPRRRTNSCPASPSRRSRCSAPSLGSLWRANGPTVSGSKGPRRPDLNARRRRAEPRRRGAPEARFGAPAARRRLPRIKRKTRFRGARGGASRRAPRAAPYMIGWSTSSASASTCASHGGRQRCSASRARQRAKSFSAFSRQPGAYQRGTVLAHQRLQPRSLARVGPAAVRRKRLARGHVRAPGIRRPAGSSR